MHFPIRRKGDMTTSFGKCSVLFSKSDVHALQPLCCWGRWWHKPLQGRQSLCKDVFCPSPDEWNTSVILGGVTAHAQQCPALPGQGSLISCRGPWWGSTADKEILWTVHCFFWVSVLFRGSRLFPRAISGFDCWSSFSLLPSSRCLGWKRGGLNAHWTVVLNLASPRALLRNLHFHAGGRIRVNLNDLSKFFFK